MAALLALCAVPFGVAALTAPKGEATPQPTPHEKPAGDKPDCTWKVYDGMQWETPMASLESAFGATKYLALGDAKRRCLELGLDECKAVACNAKDECVPRTEKTGGLKPATSGEKTYVPPEACTWLELITQLEEEVEAEDTLGVAPGDEQKEAGADVIQDWVNLMHDFESNVLVSMHLKAGTTQVFYEEAEVGQLVRGAFFASSADEASDVRFVITSPTDNKVLEHYGHEAVFHFKAKEQGAYKFTMNNPGWVKSKQCTFTVGVTATQKLASHDLDQTEMKISRVLHLANDAQAESKYLWLRERGRLDHNTWVHERVLHMAIAQFLVFIFVCGFQIYYMKGLLSDRRVL